MQLGGCLKSKFGIGYLVIRNFDGFFLVEFTPSAKRGYVLLSAFFIAYQTASTADIQGIYRKTTL
jgi:hypothetical protein